MYINLEVETIPSFPSPSVHIIGRLQKCAQAGVRRSLKKNLCHKKCVAEEEIHEEKEIM